MLLAVVHRHPLMLHCVSVRRGDHPCNRNVTLWGRVQKWHSCTWPGTGPEGVAIGGEWRRLGPRSRASRVERRSARIKAPKAQRGWSVGRGVPSPPERGIGR